MHNEKAPNRMEWGYSVTPLPWDTTTALDLRLHQPCHIDGTVTGDLNIDMFMTFMAQALPGNSHLHYLGIYPRMIDRGTKEKLQWMQILQSDTVGRFESALRDSNVFEIEMPERAYFAPEPLSFNPFFADEDDFAEEDCARVRGWIQSLRRVCARNGVRMMAANDAALTHFDAMSSGCYHPDYGYREGPVELCSGRYGVPPKDDVTICKEIAVALIGNTHVQTIQTAINSTLWSTDAAVECMINRLPQSRVVDVDIAHYQCKCGGQIRMLGLNDTQWQRQYKFPCWAWCHDAESDQAVKAHQLMDICLQNALKRLRGNDPELRQLKWYNKFFGVAHIEALSSAICGNDYLETLVIYDEGVQEDQSDPDPGLRSTWRHDQAAMTALKTAIGQSALAGVSLFSPSYPIACPHHESENDTYKCELCKPLCAELDALCANSRNSNKWIRLNRPYQRMMLAAIHSWLDLPFTGDCLELACGHLQLIRVHPASVHSVVGAELERFAWHQHP
jgi:hypothetical protein